jgi:hypothetical protein
MGKASNGGPKGGSKNSGGRGRPAPLPPGKGGWPTNNGTGNRSGTGRNNAPPKKK